MNQLYRVYTSWTISSEHWVNVLPLKNLARTVPKFEIGLEARFLFITFM